MPGFIDTHWHLWFVLFRGIVDDLPDTGWFPTKARLGPFVRAEDQEAAVQLSLVEALSTGITTVHNWAHNIAGPADAEANVRARSEVPARMHFSYGTPSTHPGLSPKQATAVMKHAGKALDEPMDMRDVAALRERWPDPLLTSGWGSVVRPGRRRRSGSGSSPRRASYPCRSRCTAPAHATRSNGSVRLRC
ncbi:MAG TPA: amidohydrolase family protein [Candidatus Limnocylindria bacterium]|nr:amidohydrolase family protein [Candidatus Limnocylindria bacterium]